MRKRVVWRARCPTGTSPFRLDVQGPAGAAGGDVESAGFSALVSTLFLGIGKTLGDELARLRYIGPVRALHPPTRTTSPPSDGLSSPVRDHLDDRAATPGPRSSRAAAWADGSAAWTMLLEAPHKFTERRWHDLIGDASVWLKDRLDTGYALRAESLVTIERSRLDELVKRAELPDPERMNELDELAAGTPQRELRLVTAKSGLPVRPSDVGTGVSQILPVVVAALDPQRPGTSRSPDGVPSSRHASLWRRLRSRTIRTQRSIRWTRTASAAHASFSGTARPTSRG